MTKFCRRNVLKIKENLWLFNYGYQLTKMIWKDKRSWIAGKASLGLQLPRFVCSFNFQKHLSRGVLRKSYSENMQQIYGRAPMPKCDFNKVAFWNRTSAWVLSCKFAAYFQKTFSSVHLWTSASFCSIVDRQKTFSLISSMEL